MNTVKKSTKIILIILTALLVAVFSAGVFLFLPNNEKSASDVAVTNTTVTKQIVNGRHYIIASTREKADAYAEKLGIPSDKYDFESVSGALKIVDGVLQGMNNATFSGKFAHLILPNEVTSIDVTVTSAAEDVLGLASVKWVSIMTEEGSQLESFTGESTAKAGSSIGGAYLERVDLSNATKLTSLPDYIFKSDRLQHIALPESIASMGEQAISSKSINHLSLPSGLGADGSGLRDDSFQECENLVEIELPSNANESFVNKIKGMNTVRDAYMNVYVKGAGRSWLTRTVDGFVFCKNILRTAYLASGLAVNEQYKIGKWYLVGYHGTESGGDAAFYSENYMVTLPTQVDLAKNSVSRAGQFDYIDCSGVEIQNDFSSFTTQTDLGSNVAVNGAVANNDAAGKRIIAGALSDGTKLRYDINSYTFHYRWIGHATIPDNAVSIIGDRAFIDAAIYTFNIGDVQKIGNQGLALLAQTAGGYVTFYLPSTNPEIAADGFSYIRWGSHNRKRLFVYRNYSDYNAYYAKATSGLQKAANDFNAGEGKYYSYLLNIVPHVAEWDESANAYIYTAIAEEKMQRLYTGNLASYNGDLYDNGFSYVRSSNDEWTKAADSFPALTEYTGYPKTNWFTDTTYNTQYTEESISTAPNGSAIASLRNAQNKGIDEINIYSKKIVSFELENKERTYTDGSLNEKSPEITGIPSSIINDYTINVSYVDSNGVAKTYESIGKKIQEAGTYTLQVRPDEKFGEWDATDIPTMTVTIKKATIDLGDYDIFRIGVTSDGIKLLSFRPGKEDGENKTTLYYYVETGSWYTSPQSGISESYTRTEENIWDSYIRAEGSSEFRLALISPIVKDKYDNSVDVFDCAFSNVKRSNSGEYTENFTVELTDRAKNNYQFSVTNDDDRRFHGYVNESGLATITKTWYIVQLNNWLTNSDYVGDMSNSPSYSMATEWEFGPDKDDPETKKLFKQPKIAFGEDKADITFNLLLNSSNFVGATELFSNVPLSEYNKYINSSLPVGSYKIVFNVNFPDGATYDPFQQSYEFKVTEKDFTIEERNAIGALVDQIFEYDVKDVKASADFYEDNGGLFDLSNINKTYADKIKDMLFVGKDKTPREGIWENNLYNQFFSDNFEITYNLNRMWNNTYSTLKDLLKECPMDTPDEYVVYFQLTAKNRKSLISETNDADRRGYYFTIKVFKTMSAPKINDFTYNSLEIFPTLNYEGGALASESIYYSVALPSGQDNVNQGKKKAILTIDDNYYQLYRFAAEDDTPQNRKFSKSIEIEYKINPANNSTIQRLYIADWSWGSEIKKSDIIWQTQFGNNRDDFTFTLVADADAKEYSLDEFKDAPAGKYSLKASCPADKDNGNWLAYIDTREITISAAINTWKKSPSISTWTWNQYENFDWDAAGAVSPIQIHAIPTYYTTSTLKEAGSGRFDFRVYSIDEEAEGNAKYKLVYFDDDEQEFHFQYAKNEDGEFIKNGNHFVLPLDVAKRLAALPAGQYYLVATVYSTNNYTGLNNSVSSFLDGAVPFTIGSANNVWSDTISTADWTYSEFELGRHIYTGKTKYETQLTYAIYDRNKTNVISVLGKELKGITDFTAVALSKDGKEYTYAELVNMLAVGSYTLTVHGEEAEENERGGINYYSIDDERKVSVTKALNTLTETFSVNDFTIGGEVDMTKFIARFDSDKVGYRISKGGRYIDDNTETLTNPIIFASAWDYDKLKVEIAKLAGDNSGRDYTVWYVTTDGDNYAAQFGSEVFTVFLGQNDWIEGLTPTMSGWTYDKTAHAFDKSSISLVHEVDDSLIEITYHDAVVNSESGIIEVGPRLSGCPINTGTYYIRITVPTDDYYMGMSIDLPFQITKAGNDFSTLPKINNNGWVYSYLKLEDIITGAAQNKEDDMQIQFVVTGDVSGDDETQSVEFRYATLNWMLGSGADQSNNEILLNAFYTRLNTLDVGTYKMQITLTESRNYNSKTLADVVLTVSKAANGWQDGKEPIINSTTKWEWNNYSDSVWKDIATKFGELTIEVDGNEVAYSAVPRYLSTLEVGSHKIKFIVKETNNYSGFEDERTFSVTQNANGWKDGEKDTTAYVDDWTWGEYNNGFEGTGADRKRIWEQPAANLGTPYATLYKGKDGVGGTLIASDIALYSLDIIMNGLDAGSYYIIWTIAEDKNYKPLTREYINFNVKVNDNKWLTPPSMHENDKKASSGIDYGWSWGTYHDDDGDYFTAPKSLYGIVEAKITKSKTTNIWSAPEVIIEGISNQVNIDNTLSRLDVGRYRIVWKAADPQNTGNYKEIEYEEIEFIVNRGVNAWTDGNPHIEGWQWGAYSDDLWQAPTLQSGYPNARVIKLNDDGTDGETVITKSSPILLGAQLEKLEVGKYRIIWTAEDDDNAEITGENPDELNFEVSKNKNGWEVEPKIKATGSEWQWNTFTLAYWQRPTPKYSHSMTATVYRLNEGCDFKYDNLHNKYIFDDSECSAVEGITLATLDGINNLSVGKYLLRVIVPEDEHGRFDGIETVLPFTVVPNENGFTSDFCYINDYAYSEFRGYWGAPTAQFGDVVAKVYRVNNGVRELLAESSLAGLNDALKDLHTGTYALDWTIVAGNANYVGGQKITNYFEVEKADNRWTARPTIKDWTWGTYDSSIVPTATPVFSGNEAVYFKIVDSFYGEIDSFREYAERFTKNANGDYYDDGLVLTRDGYFTNIAKVAEVVKNLKPGKYHLLAIYPEMEDYKRLDKNNDHIFEIYYAENKWIEVPQIDNWFYGSSVNLPSATSAYGTVEYTYYKAVYDEALGKYRIDGEAISTGENPPEKVGKYILVASAEAVEGYGPLYAEVFFEIYDKYNIAGVSSDLLVWIDIALATIASIIASVIIYQLLKARSKNDDEIFNG